MYQQTMKTTLRYAWSVMGLLCLLLGIDARAQSDSLVLVEEKFRGELAIGLRGGYQFSRVNYNVAIVQGIQEGFSGGLILQYLSQRQLGIQLEVNYSQRGLLASTSAYRVSRQQDYLEIPFMTHFALGKKSFRVVLNLGSYLSFLLRETTESLGSTPSYYLLDLGQRWTFGLTGGLGLALRSSIGVFQVEGKGAVGLTDLFNPAADEVFSRSPEQFFGWQVAYLYRFGPRRPGLKKLRQ